MSSGFCSFPKWLKNRPTVRIGQLIPILERVTVITGRVEARSDLASVPVRFARKQFFPEGWELCLSEFLGLFHRYGYIYRPLSGGSWYSANEKWKLSDTEILKAISCAHGRYFIGCRAGKASRFAVLDIDAGSRYHNPGSLSKILDVLSRAGLGRSSLYRSSYSGGWHLYIYFSEPINSADLRQQLVKLLTLNDFQVGKGQLEVFPHPGQGGSQGLGLRLPLQQGFAWLDKRTLEVDYERHELSATRALELIIDSLESDTNSFADFQRLKTHVQELDAAKSQAKVLGASRTASNILPFKKTTPDVQPGEFVDFVRAVFQQLPPGIITDNWYQGRLYHLNGLTGPSQRAHAIETLGHYLFYGDPSRQLPALGYGYEQERQWAIEEFLRIHHNGQSKELNAGRADAMTQVERATHWLPEHKRGDEPVRYTSKRPISWVRENANRQSGARKRIMQALETLKKEDRQFTTVELQRAAGCARDTLYKHQDIWRQDYEDLASEFFAICPDEYNGVEGAALPESKPPATTQTADMPPERLAARRIAYEISMRNARDKKRASEEAAGSLEGAEDAFMGELSRVVNDVDSETDASELKTVLVVLATLLSRAPNYECQVFAQEIISRVRSRLEGLQDGPQAMGRSP